MLQKLYTTKEIAQQSGYCEETVRNLCKQLGFTPVEHTTDRSRQAKWSYIAFRSVIEWKKAHEEIKVSKTKKPEQEMNIEELRKLHPLVKDDRFFKTSYFPDVTPKCFEDIEDD